MWRRVVTATIYRHTFGAIGGRTVVFRPGFVSNERHIYIGCRSLIRYGARLEVVLHGQDWEPVLKIGDNVNIEQNVHIICHDRVTIGDNVSITGHCAIVDVTHPIPSDARVKIGDCIDSARSSVEIGDGTFIGFGSSILPNVRIGRNCVIGAGSVVTRDVPDYSIAAGSPAKVLGRTAHFSSRNDSETIRD